MNDEKCSSCQIVIGGKEERYGLIDYRGRRICSWCMMNWERREELAGREITFNEFNSGIVKE